MSFECRVYYEDTDAGGVVYYANYLKFAERARTEALRAQGIHQSEWLARDGLAFVVRQVQVDYNRPARLDERLTIDTQLTDSGRASITLTQRIVGDMGADVALTVRLALVNQQFKPQRLPNALRETLVKAF